MAMSRKEERRRKSKKKRTFLDINSMNQEPSLFEKYVSSRSRQQFQS